MQNAGCDHVGYRVYARRTLSNGAVHYCVQCRRCKQIIKTVEHGYRLYVKASEIPHDEHIYPFIEG